MQHTNTNGNPPKPERPVRRPRNKRGGQPGNQNAYKHGLYFGHLPVTQRAAVRHALESTDLRKDIRHLQELLADILQHPHVSESLVYRAVIRFEYAPPSRLGENEMERVTALGSPFVRGVPPKETPPLSPRTQPQQQPPSQPVPPTRDDTRGS